MPEEQIYSVSLSHRPCRIAFLLDPDTTDLQLLDKIVDFCVDHWGGRYNPIIPIKDGDIYPEYKKLLNVADPDVIYHFSKLSDATLDYLDWTVGPIALQEYRQVPGQDQLPPIHTDHQTSLSGMVIGLRDLFPPHFRRPEPSILAFNYDKGEDRRASRFIRWNFGVSWSAYSCHRDSGVAATLSPSPISDREVLRTVAATRNLVVPTLLARNAPVHRILARPGPSREFTICYGSNPWNLVEYWNDVFFQSPGQPWDGGIRQIWIPESVAADEDIFKEFIELIRHKVYVQQGSRGMRMHSYDHASDELDQLAERIRVESHGHLHRSSTTRFEPGVFDAGAPEAPLRFYPSPASMRAGKGRTVFFESGRPPGVQPERQDAWMVDLWIENPYQEKPYANSEPWWKLPKRSWVAQTFAGARPSTVLGDGRLSLRIDAKSQGLGFRIPEPLTVLKSLLLPNSFHHATGKRQADVGECLYTSDKGKYLNGVVSLFSTLEDASYFFENPFWRSIFQDLCCPKISSQTEGKVSHDVAAHLHALELQIQTEPEEANRWLSRLIIETAQRIPIADNPITFATIEKKYKTYAAESPDEWVRSGQMDVTRLVSALTKARVLFQGAEIRCSHCISKFWYHVDDLKNELICKGCRSEVSLPAQSEWSYQPNELLRAAMRHHGVIPVIRVLGRLAKESRECFLWSAGLEYANYERDRMVPQAEIDLCCVLDGEFCFAEVKSSADGFGTADIEKIVKVASAIRPRLILLAAVDGDDRKIERALAKLAKRTGGLDIEVRAMKPSQFVATPIWAR